MSVLVVDDDNDVRLMFADFLRDEGHTVLEASGTREARQRLAENAGSVRLVLTDVRMPGETGLELARHVHQHYPHIAVLLVSGEINGADIGNETIILKPFSLDRLAAVVADLLERQAGNTAGGSGDEPADLRERC